MSDRAAQFQVQGQSQGPPYNQPSLFGDAHSLGYEAGPVYDEMVTGTGRLRPHWQTFRDAHGPFDPDAMAARWDVARRLLFQHGVTYTAYADPSGVDRPWPLDPIPFLLPHAEWLAIEAGLIQRARLLELALRDLYGPQTLIARGVLPPALLHADPGFLRPCHGLPVPGGRRLVFLGFDLVRGPDGVWRVLASRTQAPGGAGYALENRVVLGRTLPDAFRHCNAHRLAPFFEAFHRTLAALAPAPADGREPRVVIITPGPFNEAYFEHAFLARYLGLTLVEGADLAVRDRTVYLKTLSGLERVDVILRRVDDAWCDPLELRPDSALGVPGLLEAIRAGTVAVANAPGTGLTDSPALIPFMPALAAALLGGDLLLPDVPTLWAGRPDDRAALVQRIGQLVVRAAFSALGGKQRFGPDLPASLRAELVDKVRARPEAWAAQDIPRLSTAPVWRDGRLEPKPIVLRVFLAAAPDGADGWIAMPGGLARVSADPRYPAVSLQDEAGAKDTWVVRQTPDRRSVQIQVQSSGAPAADTAAPSTGRSGDLPSRAADHFYWVGRYAERAELALRILRAANARVVDDSRPGAAEELVPLLRLMGWIGLVPAQFASLPSDHAPRGMRQALEIAAFDPANPFSLRSGIERLRRSAGGVRDRLTGDIWRVVSLLERQATALVRPDPATLAVRFDELATTLAALSGLEHDAMGRSHGWRFLVLGRRIERAVGIVAMLRGTGLAQGGGADRPALEVILELIVARMAYRDRHGSSVRRGPALALLLTDLEHPRSLAFQLDVIATKLGNLPKPPAVTAESPAAEAADLVREARALVEALNPADSLAVAALMERLDSLLPEASNRLGQAWFSHAYAQAT